MGQRSRGRSRRRDLLGGAASLTQAVAGSDGLDRSGSDEVADHPDLGALLADTRWADRVPVKQVPATISQLSAMITQLAARQMQAQCEPHPGSSTFDLRRQSGREWLTIEEASSQYPVSKSWLYRNAMRLGFAKKMGTKVLISVQLFERYLTEGRGR